MMVGLVSIGCQVGLIVGIFQIWSDPKLFSNRNIVFDDPKEFVIISNGYMDLYRQMNVCNNWQLLMLYWLFQAKNLYRLRQLYSPQKASSYRLPLNVSSPLSPSPWPPPCFSWLPQAFVLSTIFHGTWE